MQDRTASRIAYLIGKIDAYRRVTRARIDTSRCPGERRSLELRLYVLTLRKATLAHTIERVLSA